MSRSPPPASAAAKDNSRQHVSPSHSTHSNADPSLQFPHASADLGTLINHLLAAKRSLSSIIHVWRANELVTSARAALEESVVLGARSSFLKRGIAGQARVLRRVRNGVENVAREGQREFEALLQDLDGADARLQKMLDELQSTAVEPAFRPAPNSATLDTDAVSKTLHDFVDSRNVDTLKESLRASIDEIQSAQRDLSTSLSDFDADLQTIDAAIKDITVSTNLSTSSSNTSSSQTSEILDSPIPGLLSALEAHAKEVADLLQSLVRHYDLCVTAIRHTEGGGAAARSITGDLPSGVDVLDREDGEASNPNGEDDDDMAPPEPITPAERADMLAVLATDAAEVDPAVAEIRERLAEMEAQSDAVSAHLSYLSATHAQAIEAFHLLEEVGARLPLYVSAGQRYRSRWEEERAAVGERLEELEGLREFYGGFLRAYDGLIVEVARRRGVQVRMEGIIREAMGRVEKLWEEDAAERDAFRIDQGDFLPSDIWPGLSNPPIRYQIERIDGDGGDVPELPKVVIQRAMRRAGDLDGK